MNVTEKKVAIDINQTAILTCLSHGVPTPRFRWYKGTEQLYTNHRVKVSVCVSVCQSVCLSVSRGSHSWVPMVQGNPATLHQPQGQGISLSVCLSICLSVCLTGFPLLGSDGTREPSNSTPTTGSRYLSVCLFVCLSVSQSVCLSVCLSICQSVCLLI